MRLIKNKTDTVICFLCYLAVAPVNASGLNLDFLRGVTTAPSILNPDIANPKGVYDVTVNFNGKYMGYQTLTLTALDEKQSSLCLTPEWLKAAGILFDASFYASTFNASRQCYSLAEEPYTQVTFDLSNQRLNIAMPQAYLYDEFDSESWDFGQNGARIKYTANFNDSTQQNSSAFGNVDLGINLGRWSFNGNVNASTTESGSAFTTNNMTVSTPISDIRGDILLGRTQTRTDLFTDFGFYGVSVRSNNDMVPWDSRSYAPIISGIADSPSRITISQDGYTILSKVVPAGPYQLTEIPSVGNSDITVKVDGDNGSTTVTTYPIGTLPTLLRSGGYEYNFAVGKKTDSADISDAFLSDNSPFLLGSMNYGLLSLTLGGASILNGDYQSIGVGVTRSLGSWGALSADIAGALAHYDNDTQQEGVSVGFKYAKSFSENTDIQLLAYRYQSSGYVEFADFDPEISKTSLNDRYYDLRKKSRYEARVSHQFERVNFNAYYWHQNYWQESEGDVGVNVTLNTTIYDGVSVYLSGAYTDGFYSNEPDYSMTMSISIPFDFGGIEHYNFNSVGYSKTGGLSASTGVSATINERLNYNASINADRNVTNSSVSMGYAFDRTQTNLSLSQGGGDTSVAGGISGSVIATVKTGVIFTKESSDSVAVINIKDIPDVTFNNSLPTDSNGHTVVGLNNYSYNDISINPENVPDHIELTSASVNVVPTEHAIVYREFSTQSVLRYILRVKDNKGKVLTGGQVTSTSGDAIGFIAANGVLLINLNAHEAQIEVGNGSRNACFINMTSIKPGTGALQEVICE